MIAYTRRGGVLNVGRISATSDTLRRPLVPAPTKITRPPFLTAVVTISATTAMRALSRCTAVIALRSSLVISSMISSVDARSIDRLQG